MSNGRSSAMQLAAQIAHLKAELAAARAKLAELEARADVDPMLDILNRRGFERALSRALAHLQRYGGSAALVYLDLDGFKPMNDRHGHAAGDAVLKAVANALTRNVRTSDIVGRLGGDEFVILLWNLDARQATAKASALEHVVAATEVVWAEARLRPEASAGFATVRPRDDTAILLKRADDAMYVRKRKRKARAPTASRRKLRR